MRKSFRYSMRGAKNKRIIALDPIWKYLQTYMYAKLVTYDMSLRRFYGGKSTWKAYFATTVLLYTRVLSNIVHVVLKSFGPLAVSVKLEQTITWTESQESLGPAEATLKHLHVGVGRSGPINSFCRFVVSLVQSRPPFVRNQGDNPWSCI